MSRTVFCAAAAALLAVAAQGVAAFPLVNGDFSDPVDLASFTASGGTVGEPTGEFAQLETDGSFERTLSQAITIPVGGATFGFDFAFSAGPVVPTPGAFPDAFSAEISSTGGDWLDLLVVDLFGVIADPADGIEAAVGATPIDVAYDSSVSIAGFTPLPGAVNFSGRISLELPAAVLGYLSTITFRLFDEAPPGRTIAAIDNLRLDPIVAAPEPTTLALLLAGIIGFGGAKRARRT